MPLRPTAKLTRKSTGRVKAALASIRSLSSGPYRVKVGWPSGTDPDIVMRAALNEFGTRGGASGGGWGGPVPERPMLRNTMRGNRPKYQHAMKAEMRGVIKAIVAGQRADTAAILSRLGIRVQGDIQSTITSLQSPPNSPVTIALKNSANPLINTGEMRQKVTYSVEKSGGGLLSSVARSLFR